MRVLVVDDEPLARARLLRMLARIDGIVTVEEAESGVAALAAIKKNPPDVVLLDVEMPGLDGLAVAETEGMPPVIFTTAHVHFATDAFDLDAVDYLTKPIRKERLEEALKRARRRAIDSENAVKTSAPAIGERLTVHGSGAVRFVDVAHVVAFRALDKYTELTVNGEELLVRESLDSLEARLLASGFIRVHRAALVRTGAITALATKGGVVVAQLSDGTGVEVSRRQAPQLRRLLGIRR